MAEKPIIFSTEMVRAILEGRKTQTRRVIKNVDITNSFDVDVDGSVYAYCCPATGDSFKPWEIAPWEKGDILWVRETWAKLNHNYKPDYNGNIFIYKADHITGNDGPDIIKWRSPIHMPRKAARIFLKVKNIRVERLQAITEDDAEAEGAINWICQQHNNGTWIDNAMRGAACAKPKRAFALLWNSIHEKRGYGWETNPWVWVIEFEKVEPEI
jgi:hypothetical protein